MVTIPNTRSANSDVAPIRRNHILSPSALTFLWEECPRCFYMQSVRGMKRPSIPMPGIFNQIDARMKTCFMQKRTEETSLGLPGGTFAYGDEWVQSGPIVVPGQPSTVTFRGKFDTALLFDDGTAGMCDFKCSSPRATHIPYYSRQLHAYTLAVENPAPNRFALPAVQTMGLIVFEPKQFKQRTDTGNGIAAYFGGGLTWIPIDRDDAQFFGFMALVVSVLDAPTPPASGPNCPFCKFLHDYQDLPH